MRPDLFGGSALRDDSHRILARLANGGSVPAPAPQWKNWDAVRRSQLAAMAALFAAIAAAWAWLQDDGAPKPAEPRAAAHAEAPLPPAFAPLRQAATIVNEAPRPAAKASEPPIAPAGLPPPAKTEARLARPRAARPAAAQRGQPTAPAGENDEDVTLLTAMLKHAKPQQPAAIPPKER